MDVSEVARQVAALSGSANERLEILREVFEREPRLARAARHLPVLEQLRLTLELVRGHEPERVTSTRTTRCVAIRRRDRTRAKLSS